MPAELRQAIRSLFRSPIYSVSVICTLAIGVGANTGAFSAIDRLLLQALPYPEPDRLTALFETTPGRQPRDIGEANLLDWRERTTSFDAMAAFRPRSFGLTINEQDPVTVIQTGMATADFFRVLRVPPAIGRTFSEQEEIAEAHLVVLTDRLWRRLFAAQPDAIGRTVFLNEEPHTVIGVMPAEFEFPMDRVLPDAFIPLSRKDYGDGRIGGVEGAARLKPGVSLERARAELESVAAAIAAEHPNTNRGRSAGLQPLHEAMRGSRRRPLVLLLSAAALLLMIACANAAGLILARALARSHETAIRLSLGAGTWTLVRHFLAESVVLSVCGAASGLLCASLVLRVIPEFIPSALEAAPLHLDAAAFGSALVLAVVLTIVLSAAPALMVRRTDLHAVIKAGGRHGTRSARGPLRSFLVVTQVALCVVLLLSAGLLLRSFLRLTATSPGFETAHALEFGIGLPEKRYATERSMIDFHRELVHRLQSLPGVAVAGAASRLPLRGGAVGLGGSFQIAGQNIPLPVRQRSWRNYVTPEYFAAMGIPLIEGRTFSWQDDRPGERRTAIVNQTFARVYLRDRRPVGTVLEVHAGTGDLNPTDSRWEIVGVVGDSRQVSLDNNPVPEVFSSMSQAGPDGASYVVRTIRDDPGMAEAITKAVAALDPRLEQVHVIPLRLIVERNLGSRNAAIRLVGAFGGLALLLTAVGVYGMVSFRATERSREMAIRAAVGATSGEIQRLVLGQGLRLAAAGSLAGLAAFLPVSGLLRDQLYGIGPGDPVSILAAALCVVGVALAASLGPSRKAARATPMDLLREQ